MSAFRRYPLYVAALAAAFVCASIPNTPQAAENDAAPDAAVTTEALVRAVAVVAARPAPTAAVDVSNPEYFEAWRTIRRAGPAAVPVLKAAVDASGQAVEASAPDARQAAREQAAYFRVNAAYLIYQAAGLDEAEAVAALWTEAGPAARQWASRHVYGVAFDAAATGDPRALTLLKALLADTQNDVRFRRGYDADVFDWPDTHVVLWAAAGPAAEATLLDTLAADADDATLASALAVAAKQTPPAALPAVRTIAAREGAGLAKCVAVQTLGVYGHPADFEGLREGLRAAFALPADHADRNALLAAYVSALGEFGDMRAAADLRPLMGAEDLGLRESARGSLIYMLTPAGLADLRETVAASAGQDRADADVGVARLFAAMGVPANEYDALGDDAKKAAVDAFRRGLEDAYEFFEDEAVDAGLTLADLLAAVASERTVTLREPYENVEPRHFLRLATVADRPAFLAARAAIASALPADALDSLDTLSAMLTRLTRAAYRTPVGFGEAVTAVAE